MVNRPKKQNVSIQQIITALLDEQNYFPPAYLYHFSDLEGEDLEALHAAWLHASPHRRFTLLESLEELAEEDTLVAFDNVARMALNDSDARVRTVATRLLSETEDPKLAPVFMRMLAEDSDINVRAAAATALGLFVFLGELEEIPEKIHHKIEDRLIAAVSEPNDVLIQRRALESLGFSGRTEVPPLIRQAYETEDPDWLVSALFAMGRSADDTWGPEVLRMLRHSQTTVQAEAVRAAGELELDAARRPLIQLLDDELIDIEVRAAVYWSLSKIGGGDVREILEDHLEESEDEDEVTLLEEALQNLDFTEEINMFDMLDIDDIPEEDESIEEFLAERKARVVNLEEGEISVGDEETTVEPGEEATEDEAADPEQKPDQGKKRHRHHHS